MRKVFRGIPQNLNFILSLSKDEAAQAPPQ